MLRKIRKNYKRLVAFFLSAAMIISNVGGNVGTVFAAEEQEERESAIFMVDGREILEAIQGLDGQEAFSKEDLEEMGLETGRKGILKKYEKLLLPEKGKVYALALDINTELALEGTALQAFYNTETKEVIFLYLNESSQAVDFYVNIDGYETKLVTVEANDANAAAGQPEAEEGREEAEKSAGGTGESANDGSKDASETSEEGSKDAESTSGESASENESSGEAAEESSKEDAPSAEQPEEKGTEDGSDKASEEGSKADESKEESEDKGQAEDGTDSIKEDGEKSDSDKKETEDSKQEDGNTDKESNDKGNAGKPNDTASDDGSSKESGEAKEESGDKADHGADGKDEGKSEEDGSKKDDADKADQADGDSEGKGDAGSESEKTSDDAAKEEDAAHKSDDGSVKEDSADKADDHDAKEEDSADKAGEDKPAKEESGDKAGDSGSNKGEDRASDEGKSDSDGADSDSGDRHERNTLSLSMSIHQAAIVAIPADEIEGEGEAEEETTAAEEKEEEPEEATTAAEVTEEETEEKTTAPEVTEEETEEKTAAAAETEETAKKETTTAAAETEEAVKEETKATQPEETTETEKASETEAAEAEKETEAETTVKAEEAAGETTEKAEETSEEATEAKTEEGSTPEEITTEAAKAEGSGQGASGGAGNSSQEITDDWEIPGKAYDTVTIQETINARAYCVAIEDVQKIVEANQGTEAIKTILMAAKTYTAETDDAEFTVGVPEGAFAEEVELRAVKIEDEAQLKEMADQAEGALEEGKTVSGIVAYDLSFVSLVSGGEVEPAKAVSVNIRMKEPVALSQEDQAEENAADGGVSVVHLPDGGEAEVVAEAKNGQETNFAFEAESFSEYVLVRTAGVKAAGDSLKNAIENADGRLVLDKDYEESSLITINQDLTIDLNGHTIAYVSEEPAADKSFLTVTGVAVTIQDSSDGLGSIVSDAEKLDALICVQGKGTLTVEGGTFENRNGVRAITAKESSTVVMTGGHITDSGVLDTNGNVGSSGGGILLKGSSFTMTGGSIEGNRGKLGGGVYATSSSTVDIKGSAKIAENHAAADGGGIYVCGGSSLTVGEAAVLSWNIADKKGGAVYGDAPCTVEIKEGENVTVEGNISGAGGNAVAGTGNLSGIIDNQGKTGTGLKSLIEASETGEIVLTQNYIETESITMDKLVTVDLNGYTINYMGKDAPLFEVVGQEGNLVLQDGANGEAAALSGGTGEIAGRSEGLDSLIEVKEGGTLTIAGGTLKSKGVRGVLSNNSTVTMTGGHIKESGIFDAGTSGSNGGGMLLMGSSKFTMTGGSIEGNFGKLGGGVYATNNSQVEISGSAEITGNKAAKDGGGIYVAGSSTVTVSGGKISGNEAEDCGGGISALGNSAVTVSGGEISGNTAHGKAKKGDITLGEVKYEKYYGGGGIFGEKDTTIILNGSCLIDRNRSEATEPNGKRGGGYNGGGGIFSLGRITMNGGTVSNNYAVDAGGGIYSAGWGSHFEMTDGTISSNTAYNDEGGGLRIDCSGLITGGTFEKNETHTTFDWGGGGIFVTTNGTLEIKNLLVTGNTAEGFGGGVGGCSSGDVQIYTLKGAAIYGNTAHGTGLTARDGAAKRDDHTVAESRDFSPIFREGGYQDYYCAGKSTVYGEMLGGGDANWIGSYYGDAPERVDGNKKFDPESENWGIINIPIYSSLTAAGWMALTAGPSGEDISDAKGIAAVTVKGNSSTTHGGGIMSNGTLILGEEKPNPEKGSIKISKTTEGNFAGDELFAFNIAFKKDGKPLKGSYSYKRESSAGISVTEGSLQLNSGAARFELKSGESMEISNLPVGTTYTVTEEGANVSFTTEVTGAKEDVTEKKEQASESIVTGGTGSIGKEETSVIFKNTLNTGSLEVSKTVSMPGGELTDKNKNDEFTFEVIFKKLKDPVGDLRKVEYVADGVEVLSQERDKLQLRFSLKHGQKVTFSQIPAGTKYMVIEDSAVEDGYITTNGTVTGEIVKDGKAEAHIVNTVITGGLVISKKVVGDHLTDLDKAKEFEFKVEFKDRNGNPLAGQYRYDGSRNGLISSGETIKLKHDETIVIHDLPEKTQYTVWEVETEDTKGYTASVQEVSGEIKAEVKDGMLVGRAGEIDSDDSKEVVQFTNTVNTGKLSVQKTVTGAANKPEDTFEFVVKLTKDGQPLTGSYSYVGSSTVSGIDAPRKGELNLDEGGKGTIRLMHGQKITISGLPVGTVYQVEEMPYDGYSVILPDNTQGTIAEKDGEITVAFTNQMETGKLSIQKIVTGEKGDKTKDFNFTITLTKDGKPLTGTYPYTGIAFEEGAASPSPSQGSLTLADGQAEISLKHGQRITLSGIPAGTSYTVTEREAGQDGYTTKKTGAEGTIVDDGEKTAEFVNDRPDTPEENTTETESATEPGTSESESTTEPSTSESESTTEPSTSETEPTTEPSATPEESSPTEEPTTPQEPATPEPTPSEPPENPTTPSRPSGGGGGGGGRDRDRNPSVTPEPTPIPPEEVPLANIDPENVPLAMMPSENPTETMVIDDESVPLFGLPKTGDRSASTGALLGVMLLSLMAACGIHMKKRKEEE